MGNERGVGQRHVGHRREASLLESTQVCKQSLSKLWPHASATGSTSTYMQYTTFTGEIDATLILPMCSSELRKALVGHCYGLQDVTIATDRLHI